MIGVELRHEIVVVVAVRVVEVREVAFLAFRAARPARAVIVGDAAPRRHAHAAQATPFERGRSRILVGEPGVVRVGLIEHREQRRAHDLERLGRRLRDDHRDAPAARHVERRVRHDRGADDEDEVAGNEGGPEQDEAVDAEAERIDVMLVAQPPAPEDRERGDPAQCEQMKDRARAAVHQRHHERHIGFGAFGAAGFGVGRLRRRAAGERRNELLHGVPPNGLAYAS
ncbi:hypothetical protein FEP36_05789 [Burkholderia multivorans]|nr:hypothetical protein [Burkholderia multivorans]